MNLSNNTNSFNFFMYGKTPALVEAHISKGKKAIASTFSFLFFWQANASIRAASNRSDGKLAAKTRS